MINGPKMNSEYQTPPPSHPDPPDCAHCPLKGIKGGQKCCDVLAAGSIARLIGDRMSICSNLQWIEFDGSQGCVNSLEFSMGEQHIEACQWLQDHI